MHDSGNIKQQPLFSISDKVGDRPEPLNPYLQRLALFTKKRLNDAPHKLISLFCGGGGLDLGLGFAGFKTLVASDITPVFVDTVTSNISHAKPLAKSALETSSDELIELAGTSEIDLVAAGPPCQSFSILGKRGALDDPRGKLALKYFELISEIKPRAFIFENVPGLTSVNGGRDWKELVEFAKEKTKYHLHIGKLNASAFGVPQFRERVVIVGFRKPLPFKFPVSGTTGIGAKIMEKTGLTLLPSKWALENVDNLQNHYLRPHGAVVKARYSKIPQGGRDKTDHTDRIDPNKPSGTVLVGSSVGGGRPHIHPFKDRVISPREAARLQSFPDWYIFQGTTSAQFRQTGNAVPPFLAYEIGRSIRESLDNDLSE